MAQVAKLVALTLLTRVVVDETASEAEILNAARARFIKKIETDLEDNIEYIDIDSECPYDPKHDGQ